MTKIKKAGNLSVQHDYATNKGRLTKIKIRLKICAKLSAKFDEPRPSLVPTIELKVGFLCSFARTSCSKLILRKFF